MLGKVIAHFEIAGDSVTEAWYCLQGAGTSTSIARCQLTFDRQGAGFPVLSPDGKWIGYEFMRGDSTTVSIMDRNGAHQETLVDDPGSHYPYSFASDSHRIAYTSCPDGVWNVYTVDRIAREIKQVTNYTAFGSVVRSPAWRPGTDQMAFEFREIRGNAYSIDLPGVGR
jgi:hypothetical protein